MTDAGTSDARRVGFIGLGAMGRPMAARLVAAGHAVQGFDLDAGACRALAAAGGTASASAAEAARGADLLITMLPDSAAVRDALLGAGGAAEALSAGALVVDMSSSSPAETRRLAADLAGHGLDLVDAPVSGGVRKAAAGTLTLMIGGPDTAVERALPVLRAMGSTMIRTGAVGSGHAVKALNNYVSAAGLAAACEAVLVAKGFGVDPQVLVDALNASTGRNNSTEVKLKPFVLSGSFGSGFAMTLMAKDLRTAAELAETVGVRAEALAEAARTWSEASAALGRGADHTEIYRYLEERTT